MIQVQRFALYLRWSAMGGYRCPDQEALINLIDHQFLSSFRSLDLLNILIS